MPRLPPVDISDADPELPPPARGALIAVWGPTGAPGRTTVSLGVAAELAGLGLPTLLVDADTYGGVIAQLVGLLEEAPGLAAAARAANQGTLDGARLAGLCCDLGGGLRLLTGICRAARWPELRPASLGAVLGVARDLASFVMVDCGFCLEQDEEFSYDTAAPRRNGATLAALEAADLVLAVTSADPVGLQRFVRGVGDLRETLPAADVRVVVNRLRGSAVPGDPEREIRSALVRHTGLEPMASIPLDVAALDVAHAEARLLCDAAPQSPARLALLELAARTAGRPVPGRRRRLLARR